MELSLRMKKILFVFLLICFTYSIFEVCAGTRVVRLSIIQTTDLHGNLKAMACLADVLGKMRQQWQDRFLYIDCGDSLQGSVEAAVTKGALPAKGLTLLKPDIWVTGNHDLDFGVNHLQGLLKRYRLPALAGNLTLNGQALPGTRIIERAGIRIGIIGITTPYLHHWLLGRQYNGLQVQPGMKILNDQLLRLQQARPHLIILAAHQGYLPWKRRLPDELPEIIRRFPQIDLVFGGHTHEIVGGKLLENGCYYVQAGAHGKGYAEVIVELKLQDDKREELHIQSRFVDLKTVTPSETFYTKLGRMYRDAIHFARQPVTFLDQDIEPKGIPGKDNPISEILARAIAYVSGADIVFHGTLSSAILRKGCVREDDLFRIVPFENGIVVAALRKEDIRMILEEQLQYGARMNGIWGVEARIDSTGKRVTGLKMAVKKERYRVAFNSYVAAGGGDRYPVLRRILQNKEAHLQELEGMDTRSALRRYLRERYDWAKPPTCWLREVKETYKEAVPAK